MSVPRQPLWGESREPGPVETSVKRDYLDMIRLIERLHRRFLDVIKTELDRLGIEDINNVQTLILSNIGEEQLTVGELTARGYYLGSNVSYNVKKLVENGYLQQERSPHDRRMTRVRLSPKGLDLCAKVDELYEQHAGRLGREVLAEGQFVETNRVLSALERFWTSCITYAR
jgi:DNA-binding MarR family transcriptional regulator